MSKLSKESYSERKAVAGQTLTGLGKWWGRKPLVLARAAILGLLMPSSEDPRRDREIFLKLMTMDEEGLLRRKDKPIPLAEIYRRLPPARRPAFFRPESTAGRPRYRKGLARKDKKALQEEVFRSLSYDEKLAFARRPEEIEGPSESAWLEINSHLDTSARSLQELVAELGRRAFGRVPRIGDAFCGGGSIPFEAARLGCEAYGSDLNPAAALLTWAAIHITGGGHQAAEEVRKAQEEAFEAVRRQVRDWGIERDEQRWEAEAFLYCVEAVCPECGWKVPLAPSWVVSEKYRCVARLLPDPKSRSFDFQVVEQASDAEFAAARQGTVRDSDLVCPSPGCGKSTPIRAIRRHGLGGLRPWENQDLVPRPDDVFGERLYCVRWAETVKEPGGKPEILRHCQAPTAADLEREAKVLSLLRERFQDWQSRGIIPRRRIEPGDETDRLLRERGWTHWHHLFNPRQLLYAGLFAERILASRHPAAILLLLGRIADNNCRLARWKPKQGGGIGGVIGVFSNQALNTLYNYGCRGLAAQESLFLPYQKLEPIAAKAEVLPLDCRAVDADCEIWITDPPYADAVNYEEISEFFLAWYEGHIPRIFPEWYADSKRALAVKGLGDDFRRSMRDCYRRLAERMPDNGIQLVMFTHQDAAVWADLALILWAAGLRVTGAWCIATETESAFKQGNYVQGTVLLVLRKQAASGQVFLDEVHHQVEAEVRRQLDAMLALDDSEDPNFGDTDYQLAAYAAALRVLTARPIADLDVARELSRARPRGEASPVEQVIKAAVAIACDHLVPKGLDQRLWRTLSGPERFYLKGIEMELHGERRSGVYQELARGFAVEEYKPLLAADKANETRLKCASELGRRELGDTGFGSSLLRHILFAVFQSVHGESAQDGLRWLRAELPDYWANRERVTGLLDILGRLAHSASMEHWALDSRAAAVLSGAVRNDHL